MDMVRFRTWWVNTCSSRRNQFLLTFLGFLIVASTSLLAFFHPIGAMAQICLLAAVWLHDQPWSHMAALAAFILFSLFNMLVFIVAILFVLNELRKILDRRRYKKLQKIAKMTPQEIAGIQNDKPEVEVIIKGVRR